MSIKHKKYYQNVMHSAFLSLKFILLTSTDIRRCTNNRSSTKLVSITLFKLKTIADIKKVTSFIIILKIKVANKKIC